jgi:hypothetical protein
MSGDFSRRTFDPTKRYSGVLMQQGRVQLDADWNEQVAIGLHQLRALARDLIGEDGGPKDRAGFKIGAPTSADGLRGGDFTISPGPYYVQGILCENAEATSFRKQPDLPRRRALEDGGHLVYLDVWEQETSSLQDPAIREVALGGPDTALRTRVVWQVRTHRFKSVPATQSRDSMREYFAKELVPALPPGRGKLLAQAAKRANTDSVDPCRVSPDARYRGFENQLYRVEILRGSPTATFRWSRDNGSVVFPIESLTPGEPTFAVKVAHLGRDDRSGLTPGDWVEVADDDSSVQPWEDGALLRVVDVDRAEKTVTLKGKPNGDTGQSRSKHPFLRRWDRPPGEVGIDLAKNGAIEVIYDKWIDLEDGIQIKFDKAASDPFHPGDYWLIPARTATGDVEWPRHPTQRDVSLAVRPHGIQHHYAPLAYVVVKGDGDLDSVLDLRCEFPALAGPVP